MSVAKMERVDLSPTKLIIYGSVVHNAAMPDLEVLMTEAGFDIATARLMFATCRRVLAATVEAMSAAEAQAWADQVMMGRKVVTLRQRHFQQGKTSVSRVGLALVDAQRRVI